MPAAGDLRPRDTASLVLASVPVMRSADPLERGRRPAQVLETTRPKGKLMISHHCDRCAGRIKPAFRITLNQYDDLERHFCSRDCMALWIDGPATVSVTARPQATVVVKEPKAPARTQDSIERTCRICGRVGKRRYVEDEQGWRCSPTATSCPGNETAKPPYSYPETVLEEPLPTYSIDALPVQSQIPRRQPVLEKLHTTPQKPVVATQAERHAEVAKQAAAIARATVTARCQDCTRTWILTGRVLQMAIDLHEQKHSHIVDNYEETNDQ